MKQGRVRTGRESDAKSGGGRVQNVPARVAEMVRHRPAIPARPIRQPFTDRR